MKSIVVAAIAGLLLGTLLIWLGVYNVAANDKHLSITENLLEVVRERSIETRSADLKAPDLNNSKLIKEGAEHYAEMCTECHLAPGISDTELHTGLYPQPPVFSDSDYDEKPEKQFWVIKNGLKMTGMPAWYPAHTDEQIWGMVAFLQVANTLSEKDYNELSKPSGDGHNHSHEPNNSHGNKTYSEETVSEQQSSHNDDRHSHDSNERASSQAELKTESQAEPQAHNDDGHSHSH